MMQVSAQEAESLEKLAGEVVTTIRELPTIMDLDDARGAVADLAQKLATLQQNVEGLRLRLSPNRRA